MNRISLLIFLLISILLACSRPKNARVLNSLQEVPEGIQLSEKPDSIRFTYSLLSDPDLLGPTDSEFIAIIYYDENIVSQIKKRAIIIADENAKKWEEQMIKDWFPKSFRNCFEPEQEFFLIPKCPRYHSDVLGKGLHGGELFFLDRNCIIVKVFYG
jgi:hypothetical protein